MTALEADLNKAVATIVATANDLCDRDSGFQIELATVSAQVTTERGITRDMVAAVDRRMDEYERESKRRHRELLDAIAKLGGKHG